MERIGLLLFLIAHSVLGKSNPCYQRKPMLARVGDNPSIDCTSRGKSWKSLLFKLGNNTDKPLAIFFFKCNKLLTAEGSYRYDFLCNASTSEYRMVIYNITKDFHKMDIVCEFTYETSNINNTNTRTCMENRTLFVIEHDVTLEVADRTYAQGETIPLKCYIDENMDVKNYYFAWTRFPLNYNSTLRNFSQRKCISRYNLNNNAVCSEIEMNTTVPERQLVISCSLVFQFKNRTFRLSSNNVTINIEKSDKTGTKMSLHRTLTLTEAAILGGGIVAATVLVIAATVFIIIIVIRRKKRNNCNVHSNTTRNNGNVKGRKRRNLMKKTPVAQTRNSETNTTANPIDFEPPHYIYIDDKNIVSISEMCTRTIGPNSVSSQNKVKRNNCNVKREKRNNLPKKEYVPQNRNSETSTPTQPVDSEPSHYTYINDNDIVSDAPICNQTLKSVSKKHSLKNPTTSTSRVQLYPVTNQEQTNLVSNLCPASLVHNIKNQTKHTGVSIHDGLNQVFQCNEFSDNYDDFISHDFDPECSEENECTNLSPLVDSDGYLLACCDYPTANYGLEIKGNTVTRDTKNVNGKPKCLTW